MGKDLPFFCQQMKQLEDQQHMQVSDLPVEQWSKIEQSYESFQKAFEALYPNRIEEEELHYMIAGSDFVADLLACLDIMEPVVDLMLRVLLLDTPVWMQKLW